MKSHSRTIRAAGVPFAVLATLLLLGWNPPGASAAPQESWVLPATDLSAAGGDAYDPEITIGPDGSANAVWERSNGANFIVQGTTRPVGATFPASVDLSATGRDAVGPQVAVAPDGTLTVVWHRSDGSNLRVQAATRPPGGGFGSPVDLSAAGQTANGPQVAVAPDGTTIVVWYRFDGSNWRLQAAVRPSGGNFGSPVDLSAAGRDATLPQIAVGPEGSIAVAWVQYNGTKYTVQAAIRSASGAFSAPVDLSAAGQSAITPQVKIAPDGTTTVIWTRYNGSNYIVQAATRGPGGTFGVPQDISASGQDAFTPQLAVGPDGAVTAVWERYNGSNDVVQSATRAPGGTFALPQDLSVTGQNATSPQIAIAPDGTATAVWHRFDGAHHIVQAATRVPGAGFGAPVDLSPSGLNAYEPQVAIGPDGGAAAIWRLLDGGNYIIQSASTARPSPTLSVTRSGTGIGEVASTPTGIDCGTACTRDFPSYTRVTLTAVAERGSRFSGWNGACSGTASTCDVTMLKAESVDAAFMPIPPNCKKATLTPGRFKVNRKKGTGTLKVKVGTAGTVILKGSRTVRKSVRKLNRQGTVTLKIEGKGRTARKLKRKHSVKVKLKISFQPKNGCEARTRTRKVKLVG